MIQTDRAAPVELSATAAEVQSDIPVSAARHQNAGRQPLIVAAVILMRAAAPVAREVAVIHQANIAAMAAINNHHVVFDEILALMQKLHERSLS